MGIWGIELLDVKIKRLNYKQGVIEKIYDRMKSERLQIAERFRSEGAGEAAKISGKKERDLSQIESDAYREVEQIRGQADAEASEIYANAYTSSPMAADFYTFVKTLDTYKTTLGRDSTLVLSTDSDLFSLLKSIGGKARPCPGSEREVTHFGVTPGRPRRHPGRTTLFNSENFIMSTAGDPSPDDPSYWVLEAVEAYELPLLRYARRLLNDFDLANDAVQHAFCQTLRAVARASSGPDCTLAVSGLSQ